MTKRDMCQQSLSAVCLALVGYLAPRMKRTVHHQRILKRFLQSLHPRGPSHRQCYRHRHQPRYLHHQHRYHPHPLCSTVPIIRRESLKAKRKRILKMPSRSSTKIGNKSRAKIQVATTFSLRSSTPLLSPPFTSPLLQTCKPLTTTFFIPCPREKHRARNEDRGHRHC